MTLRTAVIGVGHLGRQHARIHSTLAEAGLSHFVGQNRDADGVQIDYFDIFADQPLHDVQIVNHQIEHDIDVERTRGFLPSHIARSPAACWKRGFTRWWKSRFRERWLKPIE